MVRISWNVLAMNRPLKADLSLQISRQNRKVRNVLVSNGGFSVSSKKLTAC